jgi:hypothetical protein
MSAGVPAELLGAGSGIALALYLFSLIQRRAIHVSDTDASIRIPSRADGNQLVGLVFAAEWVVLTIFVLAELLPAEYQSWLKSLAISCGASIAILYMLCTIRLRRLGLMPSPNRANPTNRRPRRRRLRGRIRAYD